jgi:steroid delta-isomerase-like uncharacterized protein
MSIEQNKALARRYIEDAWNQADASVMDQLLAGDYAIHDPGTPGRTGTPVGEKQVHAMYRAVFPDLRLVIEELIAEGDRVAARWRGSGTHRGPLMGIAPTGRSMSITAISWLRIADGKIAEHWLNWDSLGMLQQLGAAPAAAQPAD